MKNLNSVDNDWLNSQSAAQLLLVSLPRLYNLTYLGHLPHYKFGRSLRFRKTELLDLIIKQNTEEHVWSNSIKKQIRGLHQRPADIQSLRSRYREEGLALKLSKKR